MESSKQTEITISNRTILRVIAMIVVTLLGLLFLRSIWGVVQLLIVSFFLALALHPAVRWLTRKLRLKSRVAATGIAYLIVVVSLGVFLSYVLPPLVKQTADFVTTAPDRISELQQNSSPVGRFIDRYELQDQVEGLKDDIRERTSNLQDPIVASAGRVGSVLLSIITVLVLTFMMLVEGPYWFKKYLKYQNPARRKHHEHLARRMHNVVTGYVNGQLLLSLIAATLAFIVLVIASTLLDVQINAIALAGILVITGLIPMIGNVIGGIIVVLASLFVSLPLALIMGGFFILYQQIENVSLQPYIHAKYNELSPLLVFVAALVGISFAGILGGLVAIPLAGCIKILLLDYLDTRNIRKSS